MKDNPLDSEFGYVESSVIRNVYTAAMRKLEESMPNSERFPIKQLVMELFESTKFAILKQRKTPAEILKAAPPELRPEPGPSQKDAHDKRVAAINGRQG